MIKIALIDSGVSQLDCIECDVEHIDLGLFDNCDDLLGHGTAIAFQLSKLIDNLKIYSIKVFEYNHRTTEEDFLLALHYVLDNLNVDIVNISAGITMINNYSSLEEIVNRLDETGTILVSAFDNCGVSSYPACLDSVIGVKWDSLCTSAKSHIYVENSEVNVLGFGGIQRLLWNDGTNKSVSGSSFAVPYITAKLANWIFENCIKKDNMRSVKARKFLMESADKVISFPKKNFDRIQNKLTRDIDKIKKVALFPFNKEMHAIIANSDLLPFDIMGIYDPLQMGRCGKKVSECCYCPRDSDLTIKLIEKIDWEENFDTLILGHLSLLNSLFKENLENDLIDKCLKFRKNIYAFDELSIDSNLYNKFKQKGLFIDFFALDNSETKDASFGCLHYISAPVIAVVGTSSRQGKFNLQLELRRRFINDNYNVVQLGTEPSSLLFGMDMVYHNGYGSSLKLTQKEELIYINRELWEASKDADIVIVGTQSHILPISYGNVGFISFSNQALLSACLPDCFILCVNATDDENHIKRTIKYLESSFESPVVALVVFPISKDYKWSINGNFVRTMGKAELDSTCNRMMETFKIPVYVNDAQYHLNELYLELISFFSYK